MSLPYPSGELAPGAWPAEVAPLDVATWAAPVLEKAHPDTAPALRAMAEEWRATGRPERVSTEWTALAVLYATLQAVQRDRQRPAVAIDAGRLHHDLLMGWRDLPKDTHTPHDVPTINHRIELLAPGRSVQLTLDLPAHASVVS